MLLTLDEVATRIDAQGLTVSQAQLVYFAEQQWVRAQQEGEIWYFDEQDAARACLICELREDMAINDEAMPLVLRLLDQVYALRAVLGEVQQAIRQLPSEDRAEIEGTLKRVLEG